MAQASVGERVYREIKRRLLSGTFAPGERLDINALGQDLASSITPVRAALSRLVGEDLLEAQARDGFHRPFLSEQGLRDLYAWNALELANALSIAEANHVLRSPGSAEDDGGAIADIVSRTEQLFLALAMSSRNAVCEKIIGHLSDQLHPIRQIERTVLPDAAEELDTLEALYGKGDFTKLAASIEAYHQRRLHAVPDIVTSVHRPGRLPAGAG